MSMTSCLNLILDEEHAVKLSHLAERTHARPGTITRSCRVARNQADTIRVKVRGGVSAEGRCPRLD